MAQTYPSLPDGPVLCSDCAKAGKQVEMVAQGSFDGDSSYGSGNLRSYRCPSCESVEVFHIG
jgi:hypothetical protein